MSRPRRLPKVLSASERTSVLAQFNTRYPTTPSELMPRQNHARGRAEGRRGRRSQARAPRHYVRTR